MDHRTQQGVSGSICVYHVGREGRKDGSSGCGGCTVE
jgi:hypothetical protein